MNRKSYWSIPALIVSILIFSTVAFLTSCSSSSHRTTTVSIAATSGTPQSAAVGTAFGAPLVATVSTNGTPTSGVSVTFTAPSTGASGTFATSTPAATDTETTNSSGVATSQIFTANTTAGMYTVTASATGATANASFSLSNTAGAATTLAATGGTPQNVVVGATAASLVANVTDADSNPVMGVAVTFTAPLAPGPTGSFTSSGTNAETVMTDASGNATASDFVANSTTGGPYDVVATATGLTSVNFALTNTPAVVVGSNTYVYYLSGQELINSGPNYYAIAGAVTIDSTGAVTAGEQDYNDGFGVTSPGEPNTPDSITGGTLTVDGATGQGTLTLITNNSAVGDAGTITLGVQFVNDNHALITEYDDTATSSGSLDLQVAGNPNGNFAFTISGVDNGYFPVAFGGVYSAGSGTVNGTLDVNDSGTVVTGTAFTATSGNGDGFGRTVVTGVTNPVTATPITFVSYVVGAEVLRIIDVDAVDSAVGSAFGQGTAAFTNASLPASVFSMFGNPFGSQFGALGQFTTSNTGVDPASFAGVGDDNEVGNVVQSLDATITGTYSLQSSGVNGYGTLTVGSANLGDVQLLGVYMTDPALNLNDPNNTTTGLGGGLLLDLDSILPGGTGVVTPQAAPGFSGNYAAGWQNFNIFASCTLCEFDMVAQGSISSGGTLSLTGGLVSDPFETLGLGVQFTNSASFTGTLLADSTNVGRYTMESPNALAAMIDGATGTFGTAAYSAAPDQAFWLETDSNAVFLGPLSLQGDLSTLPAVKKAAAKTQGKQKQ